MRLRRALLVTTAASTLMLGAGTAYAQSFDWSGFYIGLGVVGAGGLDQGTLSWFDPENEIWGPFDGYYPLGDSWTNDSDPFVGAWSDQLDAQATLAKFPGAISGLGISGIVGFNQQMDNFLFGIEASITSGPFRADSTYVEYGDVTFDTETVVTSYTTSYSTSPEISTVSVYTTSLFTYNTTVTNTVSDTATTSVFPTTESTSTYQYTTYDGDTLIEYPTVTTAPSTFISVSTTTTAIHTETITETLGSDTIYTTGNGEWVEEIRGRAQIDWLATIKGRIGVTADRTLFFATGGLAVAGVTQETTAVLAVDQPGGGQQITTWRGSNSETRFGFVVGGGIEQALDDHWIISGEAEYFNLGTAEYDVVPDQLQENYGRQKQVLDGGSVKVSIKYKF